MYNHFRRLENMEYLDIYDENRNYIGKEERKKVHADALWHNTVHCWLYDKSGNIYFQIRKEEGTLYTTASGHIKAGETIEEGFAREIDEEIGLRIDSQKAIFLDMHKYIMDLIKKDGTIFKDRAFVNLYAYDFEGNIEEFNFDETEINGLAKVNVKDTIKLLNNEINSINGITIKKEKGDNKEQETTFTSKDFLVCNGENLKEKYENILNKISQLQNI